MAEPWTVEYGNRAEQWLEKCLFCSELELPNFQTEVNLYIAPLGSYDVILGINWLSEHKALVNYQDKVVECRNDIGHSVILNGLKRPLELRHIFAMQFKKARKKGCQLYVAFVKD